MSIAEANRPALRRRRIETKQEKQARLMHDWDKEVTKENMDLRNF
jgi:hypothetical protein